MIMETRQILVENKSQHQCSLHFSLNQITRESIQQTVIFYTEFQPVIAHIHNSLSPYFCTPQNRFLTIGVTEVDYMRCCNLEANNLVSLKISKCAFYHAYKIKKPNLHTGDSGGGFLTSSIKKNLLSTQYNVNISSITTHSSTLFQITIVNLYFYSALHFFQ